MEKVFSYLILLVAAVLLVPGCFAEETSAVADANVTEVVDTTNETVAEETGMVDVTNETAETVPMDETGVINTTYTADINTTALAMMVNETVRVSLKENPTTGYMWNVTNSTGLEIVNDTYVIDSAPEGMVGVGGVHEWVLKAIEAGNQTFSGVYMRSFETPTGSEDTYNLEVTVE
jgi:inhibitor of cysteine peptidase